MNRFRKSLVVLTATVPLLLMLVYQAGGVVPGPKVSADKNKHNLSSGVYNITMNPSTKISESRDPGIKYRATFGESYDSSATASPQGRQICIFCHTPHSANNETQQTPLWNRTFSTQTFSRYSSGTLQIRVNPAVSSPAKYTAGAQPDGASKLCLSCHDGASNLGNVWRGGPIQMDTTNGGGDKITGIASFNPTLNPNKMKLGHHPVSFVYNGAIQGQISAARLASHFILPGNSANASKVKLDRNSKMQCTTCHDPHQNQSDDENCYRTSGGPGPCTDGLSTGRKVAPFWVLGGGASASVDHDDVCTSCHLLTSPKPWP